jgi:hypothetical protein
MRLFGADFDDREEFTTLCSSKPFRIMVTARRRAGMWQPEWLMGLV